MTTTQETETLELELSPEFLGQLAGVRKKIKDLKVKRDELGRERLLTINANGADYELHHGTTPSQRRAAIENSELPKIDGLLSGAKSDRHRILDAEKKRLGEVKDAIWAKCHARSVVPFQERIAKINDPVALREVLEQLSAFSGEIVPPELAAEIQTLDKLLATFNSIVKADEVSHTLMIEGSIRDLLGNAPREILKKKNSDIEKGIAQFRVAVGVPGAEDKLRGLVAGVQRELVGNSGPVVGKREEPASEWGPAPDRR